MFIVSPNPTLELNTLTALGHTGSVQDVQYKFLRGEGYTGALPDMIAAYLKATHGINWHNAMRGLRNGSLAFSAGGFDPATLFEAAQVGMWYDPSDLSTLWQDTAGTVAVTVDGDPVGRVDDKSGNGLHYVQATAAQRPIYKTDGTYHWLSTDGVNDFFQVDGVSGLTTTMHSFIGFERPAVADGLMIRGDSTTDYAGLFESGVATASKSGAFSGAAEYVDGVLVPSTRGDLFSAMATDTPHVVEARGLNMSAEVQFLYGTYNISLFSITGKFYGQIIREVMSAQEISDAQTYLAEKSGATL